MFFKQVLVIVLGVLFVTGVSNVLAGTFREPQALPPWNADAPVNTGGTGQTKAGGLTVGGSNTSNTAPMFAVARGRAGFGTGSATTLYADVDIRGSIYTTGGSRTTVTDAQRILGYLNGGSLFPENTYAEHDLDGNGVVTLEDSLIALNMAVGLSRAQAEQKVYGNALPVGMPGDVHPVPKGDGVITSSDGLRVAQIAARNTSFSLTEFRRADVNGDGTVDNADAQAVTAWAAGNTGGSCYVRGQIIVIGGTNNQDRVLVCMRQGSTTATWKEL